LKLALEAGNRCFEVDKRSRQDPIGDEVRGKVVDFYNRDDISWAAPGMRDGRLVKANTGKKNIVQKRYLTITILEAHQMFKEENPEARVGKSKFSEFRPKHVQLLADIPHNVCICKIHGNMDSLLLGISKLFQDSPRSGRALIQTQVCQREKPACMLATCDQCATKVFALATKEDDNDRDEEEYVKWRKRGKH